MIEGLVECCTNRRTIEAQYRYAIALLTRVEQRFIDGLPPNIGECSRAMKAAKKYDEDNPSFHQAMHGKHAAPYKAAMDAEVKALECAKTWTQMLRSEVPEGATVLPLTCAFKLKRYPDGTPRKFKARLCVRGDLQTEGVDYFEKYAPVVSWTTVRMLLTLTAREWLHTRMVNFTNAFAQATLNKDIYVTLPSMYDPKHGPEVILQLNKSLYGLVQAPLSWYNHLKKGLEECGFREPKLSRPRQRFDSSSEEEASTTEGDKNGIDHMSSGHASALQSAMHFSKMESKLQENRCQAAQAMVDKYSHGETISCHKRLQCLRMKRIVIVKRSCWRSSSIY